jgi:phage anti-repressor protein
MFVKKTLIMLNIHFLNDDRYVSSIELHKYLDLSWKHYSREVKRWFNSEYLFQGKSDFSFPVENYDYFVSPLVESRKDNSFASIGDLIDNNFKYVSPSFDNLKDNSAKDYMIRLELSKLIALDSKSNNKKRYVQWLLSIENKVESFQLMSQEMILGLLEISKFCTYIDSQLEYYNNHKVKYFEFKEEDDDFKEFDQWRNSVLKLNDFWKTRKEYDKIKQFGNLRTKVERIAMMDSLTSIRNALFDFLSVALAPYTNSNLVKARDLANFVKSIYETIGMKRVDILPRNYGKNGMRDLFEKHQDIDFMLVQKTIKNLHNFNS